ncbi:hypothetical protein V6Z05_15000 [Leptospira venezuelensis]|uniref:hypothetical protein n=1 Tax=Leptospira venezuelensis TaxID=1958811 RepID=UPI0012FF7010|nr:hypothetical protein [Leptospira venezuelensis]
MKSENFLSELNEQIYDLLYVSIAIHEFEDWVFKSEGLERLLSQDDYLDLMSLDYRKKSVKYEIQSILTRYIDQGSFEKLKITKLLEEAIKGSERLPMILIMFYDYYCAGYNFLEDLGLGYGALCDDSYFPELKYLKNDGKSREKVFPGIDRVLTRTLNWILFEKIVFTGFDEDKGKWTYIDCRSDIERKSAIGIKVSTDSDSGNSIIESVLEWKEEKKWWHFWR